MNLRTRGYLPHVDAIQQTHFLTFRLYDSLPCKLVEQWKSELQLRKKADTSNLKIVSALDRPYWAKVQRYLDTNAGNCWLKDPALAEMMTNTLRYFDGQRYYLHAWTVMPNHVHVLVTLADGITLPAMMHTWKSYSASRANRILNLSGRFWQPE